MLDLSKYKSAAPTMKPNKLLIPVNTFGFNDDDVAKFNEIYHYCLDLEKEGILKQFVKTNKGSIRTAHGVNRGMRWDLVHSRTCFEIVLKNEDARYYRFQIGHGRDKEDGIYGRQAFRKYVEVLKKFNIDLDDFAIDNGEEVKKTIPKPKIKVVVATDKTYYNAHHIDLNSAYQAGIARAYPVLAPPIEWMYSKRSEDPIFKAILNMTQGFMQSDLCGYRFAHISKPGYVFTNNKLDELTEQIIAKGYRILSYNTDGIWYQSSDGSKFTNDEEGPGLGQWKHDYVDCKIRFKSDGAYEFEGTETKTNKYIYKPVVRGQTTYDKIKPREEWVWGDIYKGNVINYSFIEGIGVYRHVNN